MTDANPGAQGASPVEDLIRQREQLRVWLSKLGEVAPGAPSRVAERVRKDYEDRLRRVTEELSTYQDEIRQDLERLRSELQAAEQRRGQASEVLEEARLRHLIGELDEGEWDRQQTQLQGDVDAAAGEAERARAEVERLSALAGEVQGGTAEAEPVPAAEPEGAPQAEAELPPEGVASAPGEEEEDAEVASWLEQLSAATAEEAPQGAEEEPAEEGGDLPWLESGEEKPDGWSPEKDVEEGLEFLSELEKGPAAEPAAEALAEDDLAFLEELDRAISGSPSSQRGASPATPAATPPSGAGPAAEAQSGGPLLCKECGAINEPHSWYCEVCGSEL